MQGNLRKNEGPRRRKEGEGVRRAQKSSSGALVRAWRTRETSVSLLSAGPMEKLSSLESQTANAHLLLLRLESNTALTRSASGKQRNRAVSLWVDKEQRE